MAKCLIECPHCGHTANVKEELIGKKTKCPKCDRIFTITQMECDNAEEHQEAVSIVGVCPSCEMDVYLPDTALGKNVLCPFCREEVIIAEEKPQTCPFCKGIIAKDAMVCRHCHKKISAIQMHIKQGNWIKKNSVMVIKGNYDTEIVAICHVCNSKLNLHASDINSTIRCEYCKEETVVDNVVTDTCPSCGQSIACHAKICRHCKKALPDTIVVPQVGEINISNNSLTVLAAGLVNFFADETVVSQDDEKCRKAYSCINRIDAITCSIASAVFPAIILGIWELLQKYEINIFASQMCNLIYPIFCIMTAKFIATKGRRLNFLQWVGVVGVSFLFVIVLNPGSWICWGIISLFLNLMVVVLAVRNIMKNDLANTSDVESGSMQEEGGAKSVILSLFTRKGKAAIQTEIPSEEATITNSADTTSPQEIYARCTHCNALFIVEEAWQGQETTCSECGKNFTINIEA